MPVTGLRADESTLREISAAMADARIRSADSLDAGSRAAAQVIAQIDSELARRRADLERAVAALEVCEQDPESDCSELRRQVHAARERVEQAMIARRRASEAIDRYDGWTRRVGSDRDDAARVGASLLSRYVAGLRDYSGLTVSLLGAGSAAGGSGGPAGAGGSGGAAGGGGWVPGLPVGYEMVPLSAINTSDSRITGEADFGKGYSIADLTWAFDAFDKVVLPNMAAGRGADFFHDLDAQQGLSGTRSFSMTYSQFTSGNNAIKLDAEGDGTYTVGNGYHRIWLAGRLGRSSVPAKVHR